MAETEVAATIATTPKKTKAAKPKKTASKAPTHPKVSEMVNVAISTLKERGGSSLQAIKKYIGAHYKVDVDKLSPFIRKYLKNAVVSGALIQTKGKGANGSFRMTYGGKEKGAAKPKDTAPKAKKAAPKPVGAKRLAKPKTVKKSPAAKKPKPKKLAKSPKKTKAVKPKAPKPKKAKAVKKATPKKAKK